MSDVPEEILFPDPKDERERDILNSISDAHRQVAISLRTTSDEKVKSSASDATAGYLDSKVDNTSVEIFINKLRVKPGGVNNTLLADDSVSSSKLQTSSVIESKLADDSVTEDKIADGSVTAVKLANDSVITSKILNSNVTKAKIENVASMKVLGNTSGGATAPAEVSVLDEDNMASDSATSLATQQSIKAYVDAEIGSISLGMTLQSTTTGTSTNTGDIALDADSNYLLTVEILCGGTDSAVVFAFNSDTTGTDYQYIKNNYEMSSGVNTATNSSGAASIPLGTIDGDEFMHLKGFINTTDNGSLIHAWSKLEGFFSGSSSGDLHLIDVRFLYNGGSISNFELQFSQSVTYKIKVYKLA